MMRKLLVILTFSLVVVLSACSSTKTLQCTGIDFEWIVEYNKEEVIRAYDNESEYSAEELEELNASIALVIEEGIAEDIEDFMLNHYAATLEQDGATCIIE